jgi:hypothetical protein
LRDGGVGGIAVQLFAARPSARPRPDHALVVAGLDVLES